MKFNPPPGWPTPPEGWEPPAGWTPDPAWPEPPDGWELWVGSDEVSATAPTGDPQMLPPPHSDAPPTAEDGGPRLAASTPGPQPVGDAGADLTARVALLEAENAALRAQIEAGGNDADEVVVLDDERVLQSVGIYRYHHPLEDAAAYKERLSELSAEIAALVKSEGAIEASNMFTFDNSLAKGRKMVADLSKLMLRAYNAESDSSIRSLRVGNVVTAKKRLDASRTSIAKLGKMMEMRISDAFHELRLAEIELTADWLMKKQEEKEEAREERARLREETRVAKELAAERERLDKERAHLTNTLAKLRETGGSDLELEARLAAVDDAITQNDFRAANIRAGYVYVFSNRGAFGGNVVKIGLTRRLEPLDRVTELGGASVPFRFDVHALFFSEDAVTLENELHAHFADRAVNMANARKEFFFATPGDVRAVLEAKVGNLLEFSERAEATEYLQSVGLWPDDLPAPGPKVPPH